MDLSDKKLTPIQEFYNDQSIFMTGGTGFIGKLLIEKLLRSCPSIKCIYILIRPKKGKDVHQRANELFEDTVFSILEKEQPQFRNRIVCIEGDCTLPNLGISTVDRATLIKEISVVFHVAANIKFNENIKSAATTNVQGLKYMISFSKEMPKLKSFVYVSTVYSQCLHNPIEEKFYDPPVDDDKLIDSIGNINENSLDDITKKLLGSWPNTYVYTKSVAEYVIKKQAGLMPIGIFRPAIVVPTYREPVPGWVDNLNGPMEMYTGAGKGLLRTHYGDESVKVCLVPGDLTTNALIVSAWDIANSRKGKEDVPIYNYVSGENTIVYETLTKLSLKYGQLTPFSDTYWYTSFKFQKYRFLYLFYIYFLHFLPGLIIDLGMLCMRKKPRFLSMYRKSHVMLDALSYFTLHEWKFTNEKWIEVIKKLDAKDRAVFYCDMNDVDWNIYFKSFLLGIRLYVMKDPIETIPQARRNYQRLYWIHQMVKFSIAYIFFTFIWSLISKLLATFKYV